MAETANGCLVLHRAGTIAERRKPRAEELEKTFHARLLSASGELFSLDEDLSWKSGSRKCRSGPHSRPVLLERRFWPRNHHFPGHATFRKLAP